MEGPYNVLVAEYIMSERKKMLPFMRGTFVLQMQMYIVAEYIIVGKKKNATFHERNFCTPNANVRASLLVLGWSPALQ